ncbi:MAG: hypothetical protein M3458_03565 [Acidobacteriota bacterium]|nr:hypothetical protein [Acidobacteriota bacterium]
MYTLPIGRLTRDSDWAFAGLAQTESMTAIAVSKETPFALFRKFIKTSSRPKMTKAIRSRGAGGESLIEITSVALRKDFLKATEVTAGF